MQITGYSGTPLAKKLGIKEGFKIKLINVPEYYFKLFSDLPEKIKIIKDNKSKKDFIHYFAVKAEELRKEIIPLKNQMHPDGMIWISWHKKSAKIPTDITENVIRSIALKNGLVDIKVCAVDNIWSGLKLVIPIKERN